ncbi:hypothetical protein [Aliikangiella sp. G2MR2-5]|uniref:hypothetical protein n=1 Tax=Aliikangiella sp. G2MR2-5 TaxID=2788943 RepID=UPI0018AC685C|nr:hypothetical protein [Aliikangiella sp. G2MR2-5]
MRTTKLSIFTKFIAFVTICISAKLCEARDTTELSKVQETLDTLQYQLLQQENQTQEKNIDKSFSESNKTIQINYLFKQGILITINYSPSEKQREKQSNTGSVREEQKVMPQPELAHSNSISSSTTAPNTTAPNSRLNRAQLDLKAREISHAAYQVREQSRQLEKIRKNATKEEQKTIDEELRVLREKAKEFEFLRLENKKRIAQLESHASNPGEQEIPDTRSNQVEKILQTACQFSDLFNEFSSKEKLTILEIHTSKAGEKSTTGSSVSIQELQSCLVQPHLQTFSSLEKFEY